MVPTHPERWGEVKLEKVPKINHRTLVVLGHNIRTEKYNAKIEDWSYVDPDIFDIVLENDNPHFVYLDRAVTMLDTGIHAFTGFFTLSALEGVLESAYLSEEMLFSDVVKGEGEKGVRREGVSVSVESRDVLGEFLFPAKERPTKIGGVGVWGPCRER
jgi:hypothetical protein